MKILAVIPARWQSSRLRGKVLVDINGKPMIQHVWERAKQAKRVDDVVVAVDEEKVMKAVEAFGGKAILTSAKRTSGTDRVAGVAKAIEADIYLNIQADEPMIQPVMVDELAKVFTNEPDIQMATLIKRIDRKEEVIDPNVVKVVIDKKGFALYFSRSPIPYLHQHGADNGLGKKASYQADGIRYFKHIGLYSYTRDFLHAYSGIPQSHLETAEELEQLRVLENGYKIKTIETHYETIGVNTPQDLDIVKASLARGLRTHAKGRK